MQAKEHWETVYKKNGTEVSWYQDYPQLSLQFIESTGVTIDDAILDVGGGTSQLVDNLLVKGFNKLAVLDISEEAIGQARQRLGSNADRVEWFRSDLRCFASPHRFALWHDRAVFHFQVSDADKKAYLGVLRSTLKPGGHVILATFAHDGPDRCSGLPVQRYDATTLEEELGDDYRLIESWPEEHVTPSGAMQPFIYTLFVLR